MATKFVMDPRREPPVATPAKPKPTTSTMEKAAYPPGAPSRGDSVLGYDYEPFVSGDPAPKAAKNPEEAVCDPLYNEFMLASSPSQEDIEPAGAGIVSALPEAENPEVSLVEDLGETVSSLEIEQPRSTAFDEYIGGNVEPPAEDCIVPYYAPAGNTHVPDEAPSYRLVMDDPEDVKSPSQHGGGDYDFASSFEVESPVYRTSHAASPPEWAGEVDSHHLSDSGTYGEEDHDQLDRPPQYGASEEADISLRVDPSDSLGALRQQDKRGVGLSRRLITVGIIGVGLIVFAVISFLAAHLIEEHRERREAAISVASPPAPANSSVISQTQLSTGQNPPNLGVGADNIQQLPNAETNLPNQDIAPSNSAASGPTQHFFEAVPSAGQNQAISDLKAQIDKLSHALSSEQNIVNAQNQQIQSLSSGIATTSDKNSASIALIENNILQLQNTLNNLSAAATVKAQEPAALPVPSSDASSDDASVLPGFDLRGFSSTAAVVKTPTGLFTFSIGQEIPGAGTALGWKRWNGTWELQTSAGLIRPAMTTG